jgi:drug/metabolite transporter (DMT)-like permease
VCLGASRTISPPEGLLLGKVAEAERLPAANVTPGALANLLVVYVVWGSTYLAIRVAVRPEAGVPPFTLGFVRMLVAGTILLIWGSIRSGTLRTGRRELAILAGSGLLLWTGANGMVAWAEQRVESSFAALLVATIPLWTVAIESLLERRIPSGRVALALLVGFSGTVVLSAPKLRLEAPGDGLPVVMLILAPISWSLGTLLQQRHPVKMSARLSAGYQLIFAALGFGSLALVAGEPRPHPTPAALAAWLYLILFGSVLAFTSYVEVLRSLPVSLAMTYAYVNPVIAVVLGAWLLSEPVSVSTLLGAALVLLSVAVIFRERAVGH